MRRLQKESSESIRALRRLTFLVLLIPVVFFAAAAWKDRSAILKTAESDGVKVVALFHEQAGNLFAGHQIILDMIVGRVSGLDWDTIEARPGLLDELEAVDNRLDGASEILLVDTSRRVRVTTVHTKPDELP